MIYIIGHKSPDLDSAVAAIAYAFLKNKLAGTDIYKPALAGEANKETAHILKKFGFAVPEILENLSGKKVVLVDHNESSQIGGQGEGAEIIEVLDHHKINFSCEQPIEFKTLPWGATNTIIAKEFFDKGVELDEKLAGIMLGAILSDTVITKSPTTTDMDRQMIEKLSEIAEIADWRELGMEIFKIRSGVFALSEEEIIKYDFKDFDFKAGKFGIGQMETVDLESFKNKKLKLLEKIAQIKDAGGYHSLILFITDIMEEGSEFLFFSDEPEKIAGAFSAKAEGGSFYAPGIMSRKKQVVPMLMEIFDRQ